MHTQCEALHIDRAGNRLQVSDLKTGRSEWLSDDKLMLAPGASPMRPDWPRIADPRILALRNLSDWRWPNSCNAPDGTLLKSELRHNDIMLHLNYGVTRFESCEDFVRRHLNSGAELETDLVVLAIGVRPDSELAGNTNYQ